MRNTYSLIMKYKLLLRKGTDLTLYALFCFLLGTGLLIHFRLVPGSQGGHGLTFLGLDRHQWGQWHWWASVAFLVALLVHLALNFAFIRNAIAKRLRWPLAGLLTLGLGMVGFFLFLPLEKAARDHDRHSAHSFSQLPTQEAAINEDEKDPHPHRMRQGNGQGKHSRKGERCGQSHGSHGTTHEG